MFSDSLYEDLSRRDFTINAMAIDLYNSNIIDPYNGRSDLENKLIRTVGIPEERFREDGLRILRAIRFKFKLGFDMEKNAYKAILNNWNLLDHVSQERITSEFLQILEYIDIRSQQDTLLMDGLIKCLIPTAWYKNDYDNNFWYYEALRGLRDTECKVAYLFRDAKTSPEILCKKLKFSNAFSGSVIKTLQALELLVELHMKSVEKDYMARKLVSKYGIYNALRALDLFRDEYCMPIQDYYDLYELIIDAVNKPVTLKDLAINGYDLINYGYEGKVIGEMLNDLLEIVLEDPEKNKKSILREML